MNRRQFALEPNGPTRVELAWEGGMERGVRIFVDGVLDRTTSDSTLADLSDPVSFDLGNESAFPTVGLNGLLDDVRVYKKALDGVEIQALMKTQALFKRGDSNADDSMDLSDAIFLLSFLFADGDDPACLDSADANDDGTLDLSDGIMVLMYLFNNCDALPDPFPQCGVDPTLDNLYCALYQPCAR